MSRFEVSGAVLAGKYRLELLLGKGGMASVWSAYHLELQVPVAIKLLRGQSDSRLARRLKIEARAAARVVHPAIVRVLDVGATDDGDPFIVMELLQGETLSELLSREHVSALRLVQLLLPIVEAVSLAHAQGVVHRDLKPDNVFLAVERGQQQPKLLDFGIAKLAEGALGAGPRLTDRGVALGSPSYMSPEQARGDEVDFRSDIWSLCALLYKAIGGRAPFRGADTHAILDAILEQEPAPLSLRSGVDDHLARIVLSGLNKDPSGRPASMRELGRQLARWLLLHGVATDACNVPLVTQWLTNDSSPLRPDSAPITCRISPPPPSQAPTQRQKAASRRSRRPPTAETQTSRARTGKFGRIMRPKHRWVLWALAGVLVASAAVALTKQSRTPESGHLGPNAIGVQPAQRAMVIADGAPAAQDEQNVLADAGDDEPVLAAPSPPMPNTRAKPAPARPKLPF